MMKLLVKCLKPERNMESKVQENFLLKKLQTVKTLVLIHSHGVIFSDLLMGFNMTGKQKVNATME
jgi:hypothetical protein